jgi:peptidoglycan-N-acetylmuramic acid deacetylase
MKKSLVLYFVIFMITICTGCKNQEYNANLSDLGGIYLFNENDIDFSCENSGRLSEDPIEYRSKYSLKNKISGNLNENIQSWGILRNKEGETPFADPGAPEILEKYGGIYIGDTTKKEIFLTFDEGYENGYTPKILDVLRENSAKAVFFITGPYLKEHQDLVRRMVEEGHIVGNHTIHHPSLPEKQDAEIEEEVLGLDRAFYEKFGIHMNYLRPPMGEYSKRSLEITSKLGYCNVFWSFAYDDWHRNTVRGPEYAYDIIMRNIHNGAILLLHAVSKDNADALDSVIKEIRRRGYEIGSVDNIIKNKYNSF